MNNGRPRIPGRPTLRVLSVLAFLVSCAILGRETATADGGFSEDPCGDLVCDGLFEDCVTCSVDCGTCPDAGSPDAGSPDAGKDPAIPDTCADVLIEWADFVCDIETLLDGDREAIRSQITSTLAELQDPACNDDRFQERIQRFLSILQHAISGTDRLLDASFPFGGLARGTILAQVVIQQNAIFNMLSCGQVCPCDAPLPPELDRLLCRPSTVDFGEIPCMSDQPACSPGLGTPPTALACIGENLFGFDCAVDPDPQCAESSCNDFLAIPPCAAGCLASGDPESDICQRVIATCRSAQGSLACSLVCGLGSVAVCELQCLGDAEFCQEVCLDCPYIDPTFFECNTEGIGFPTFESDIAQNCSELCNLDPALLEPDLRARHAETCDKYCDLDLEGCARDCELRGTPGACFYLLEHCAAEPESCRSLCSESGLACEETFADLLPRAVAFEATGRENVPLDVVGVVSANVAHFMGELGRELDLHISWVGPPKNGSTAILPGGGDLDYRPPAFFAGTDSFKYTVADGGAGFKATGTVHVTIEPVPPVARDDAFAFGPATREAVFPLPVLDNDFDPDDDRIRIAEVVTAPVHGTAEIVEDRLDYLAPAGFEGQDSLAYAISDSAGGTATANVTVTVGNRPPVAVDDTAFTPGTIPVDVQVLANDSDPDGDPLSVTAVTSPSHGNSAILPGGSDVEYRASPGFRGVDAFTYTVSDGRDGSATATVTVEVGNRSPVAVDDTAFTPGTIPVDVQVLANDSDPDGDPLSVTAVTSPSHGNSSILPGGQDVEYRASPGFRGTDAFAYTVSDGQGGSATATVTVSVGNRLPVAVDDAASTFKGVAVLVDVLANDSDPDGDALSITAVGAPGSGSATVAGAAIDYLPAAGTSGADAFTYTVSDGEGGTATATVTVTVSNRPPVAVDDAASALGTIPVDVQVLSNDSDPDGDPLTVTAVGSPGNGNSGILPGGRDVEYRASPGFSGTDAFTYTISDGDGGTATATVTVTVTRPNQPPVASNDAATIDKNTSVDLAVLSNDSDPDGDPLSILSAGSPPNGSASVVGDRIRYVPDTGFSGTDTFTYTVSDGAASDTASVVVTVRNRNPSAADDSAVTFKGDTTTIPVLANDSDPDGDPLTLESVSPGFGGSASRFGDRVRYRPDAGFSGTDIFSYVVSDGDGGSAVGTVFVTVLNRSPVAVADAAVIFGTFPQEIFVLGNDFDPDGDPLTVQSVTSPSKGNVLNFGTFVEYSKSPGACGADSFRYTVSDGDGGTSQATVSITLSGC